MKDFIVSFTPKKRATHFEVKYLVQATDKDDAIESAYLQFSHECDTNAYTNKPKVKLDRSMSEVA